MEGTARTEQLTFASAEPATDIHATIWHPAQERPIGIVQLVHGMAEHISRYDAFASYLASRGFVVSGHDQLGHGASCTPERWGCLPARSGAHTLVSDVGSLRDILDERFEGLPHFLFGHSMGSFVVRSYISGEGTGLAGAIICGTGFVPPATSRTGNLLARAICLLRGEDHRSPLLHSMADGAYSKAVPDASTPFDWLSFDEGNVRRYMDDPASGFAFSSGGYATLTQLTLDTCRPACAAAVPHELPLYYIAGAEDPVGDNGRGVERACQLARDGGSQDVSIRLWPNMRHEILNEAGRQEVYRDVCDWMEERI